MFTGLVARQMAHSLRARNLHQFTGLRCISTTSKGFSPIKQGDHHKQTPEPQVVPPMMHTSHADKHWQAERYLSLALLGILPAAWVIPHPFMDYAVATSLIVHVHWGIEAIAIDYIRPAIFGPVIPKISVALVYLLSIAATTGLFFFNWTDVGITQACKMLAKI